MPERCLIIAEVAQAHDGSLGTAHSYIEVAHRAGADAVKFQMHFAEEESTPAEPWRVQFSKQDASRYEYWRRIEFTPEQWASLKAHCNDLGIEFLCSPFSLKAVDLLVAIGQRRWKVASGEVLNAPMLAAMARTSWPFLVSTGMVGWEAIDRVVAQVKGHGVELTLLQCTSAYPTPAERVGLNVLGEMRDRYGVPVGLSDHSGQIFAGLAAVALGASVLEVHVTLHRQAFGPDVVASLTPDELSILVKGVREIENMRAHPVDKDAEAEALAPMRALFMKSVVLREAVQEGTVLRPTHLAMKKPGTGIPADRLPEFVGRRTLRDLAKDALLQEADVA